MRNTNESAWAPIETQIVASHALQVVFEVWAREQGFDMPGATLIELQEIQQEIYEETNS